jgi:lantibiotic biosynthesis dehydratase-like protein
MRSRGHLVRLGNSRWHTRRECVLRSAGFAISLVDRLCDIDLPAIADACADPADSPEFKSAHDRAAGRIECAIQELAADSRLREAIVWQNANVVYNCLDKILSGKPLPGRVWRQYVLTIASYVQRYAAKNDTIGFFGPLVWADWHSGDPAITVEPGEKLLFSRSLYFESWAIDAIARAFSDDAGIMPWCTPKLAENLLLFDGSLYSPRGSVVELDRSDLELLSRCDGSRTLCEITATSTADGARLAEDVVARLRSLADRGLIRLDLTGPLEGRPEITLRKKLTAIDNPGVRARALATFDDVLAARDRVAAASGDPEKLATALDGLGTAFERVTAARATRRHGEMYAGRTLVYEDARRWVEVRLGTSLLDMIAEPLSLVLESVQWLAGRAAELYESRLTELHDRCRIRARSDEVPLAMLVSAATPDLAYSAREVPPPVSSLIRDFQERWAAILRAPAGAHEYSVTARVIGSHVRAAFPAIPARWSAAVHHTPDIMIAAATPEDINAGNFTAVLGEVHVATNTLCARPAVEMHGDPDELLAADEIDHGRGRIFIVPSKDARYVNSRTYPPALLSPKYTYWTMHSNISGAPGPVLPVADLVVRQRKAGLMVRSRSTRAEFGILEVLGEYLSGAIVNSFQPISPSRHRPRVSIDRLVIARESWMFTFGEMDWCMVKSEQSRYYLARKWRLSHHLPERVFFHTAQEDKPIFCDFRSIPLINLLAKVVRTGTRRAQDGSLTLTEMLPDASQTWLRDAHGGRYTAELRMIFSDPSAARPLSVPVRRQSCGDGSGCAGHACHSLTRRDGRVPRRQPRGGVVTVARDNS